MTSLPPAEDPVVRLMEPADAERVSAMVYTAFRDTVAGGYSEEGRRQFFEYAAPGRLNERQQRGHRLYLALVDDQVAGFAEISPPSHIAQLFVDPRFQGQGIARALVDAAFPEPVTARGLSVSVNAAPETVTTYGRLGFRVIAGEQERNGVRFIPMVRTFGPVFFPVSTAKFAVMSVCSFGIYTVVWLFWNWRFERRRTGESLSPFWRTFFAPLWLHSLLARIHREADRSGVVAGWSVALTTLTTIALWFTVLIRGAWPLLSILAFVPLLPAQRTINQINRRAAPGAPANDRYTVANVILLVIGTLLLAMTVWGMFVSIPGLPEGTVSV